MQRHSSQKISVVIVTHNRNRQLTSCISSINQLFKKPDEIVVLDNSESSSAQQVINLMSNHANIKYVKIKNNNRLGYARHLGFRFANNNIVCFIDDDAYALPGWTKEIALEFSKNPSVAAIRGKIETSAISNYWSSFSQVFEESFIKFPFRRHETDFLIGANFALNKSVCLRNGIQFDKSLIGGEDIDISIKLKLKNLSIVYLPKASVLHDYRLTLLTYYYRWIDYTLFDFELKNRFNAPFFFAEYIPKRRRESVLLPFHIIAVFVHKCTVFLRKTSLKWLLGIVVKEIATLTGMLLLLIKYRNFLLSKLGKKV